MLSKIRSTPTDLDTLLNLQQLLIDEIKIAESKVYKNKKLAKEEKNTRAQRLISQARAFQNTIYFWKTFGDAIAFLYCDRFDLKHLHYNTHNLKVKQDSGIISNSVGFEYEYDTLCMFIKQGIPAVLSDITNTIRYGDICILIPNRPTPLEIKSSNTKDRRQGRQIRNLKILREFYDNDISYGFRGAQEVIRMPTIHAPNSYRKEFNECIDESYEKGHAIRVPEPGLCYISVTNKSNYAKAFSQVEMKEGWGFFLNDQKQNRAWAPYYPFTLLIESELALYDFFLGRLFLIVFLDVDRIKNLSLSKGWTVNFDDKASYPIVAKKNDTEFVNGISIHLIKRVPLEALSLKWLVDEGLREIIPSL